MDSEDDVPLSNLSSSSAAPAAVAAKRKPEEQKGDDGDDFQAEAPPAKKVKKEKKEKKEKKHKKHKKHKKEKKHKKSSSSSSSSSSSKGKAAAADPSGFKTGKVKEMKIPQLLDRAMKAHRWWMEPPLAEGQCWETLEHCGIKFAAPYEPHNVKLLYEGEPIDLTAVQEAELRNIAAQHNGGQLGGEGGQQHHAAPSLRYVFRKTTCGNRSTSTMMKCYDVFTHHCVRLPAATGERQP